MKSRQAPGFFSTVFMVLLAFSIVPIMVLAIISTQSVQTLAKGLSRFELLENARVIERTLELAVQDNKDPLAVLEALGSASSMRLTLINSRGEVLFDSTSDPATMENHIARPEVREAFETGEGWDFRQSVTTKTQTNYAALRLQSEVFQAGPWVLRVALPLPSVDFEFSRQGKTMAFSLFFIGMAAILAALWYSNSLKRPIAILERAAREWASGTFQNHRAVRFPRELASLSDSLDTMAQNLQSKMQELSASSTKLEAIIESMGEALLVTNDQGRIEVSNKAARQLFEIPDLDNNSILGLTKSTALAALEVRCRNGALESEDLTLFYPKMIRIQAHGGPLPHGRGAVLVLADVSRLVQLETVRKDFVANVSHELKTPIQSIKGFTETLLASLPSPQNKAPGPSVEELSRFLGIIHRNTLRMEALISDLLILARIEHQEGSMQGGFEKADMEQLVHLAVESLPPLQGALTHTIRLEGQPHTYVSVRPGLVEQALLNLLDNARKYTPPTAPVLVSWEVRDGRVRVSVVDHGPGIPLHEQERIFERFYRLEKSRNRDSGGTGLGLAIVRHVAILHGGTVGVSGGPGLGMTFTLDLPQWTDS